MLGEAQKDRRVLGDGQASGRLSPVREDYANVPIWEGFDWSGCEASVGPSGLYLVVFRSVRRPDADLRALTEHDDRAHEEALESGGLLRYFKGDANARRECLSFCLWESREHALAAVGGPAHGAAAALTAAMYESYELERYRVGRSEDGAAGDLTFERLGCPEDGTGPSGAARAEDRTTYRGGEKGRNGCTTG